MLDAIPAATVPFYPGLENWDRHQICWLAYPGRLQKGITKQWKVKDNRSKGSGPWPKFGIKQGPASGNPMSEIWMRQKQPKDESVRFGFCISNQSDSDLDLLHITAQVHTC